MIQASPRLPSDNFLPSLSSIDSPLKRAGRRNGIHCFLEKNYIEFYLPHSQSDPIYSAYLNLL